MAIDAVQPLFREIPAASAVPQVSLTRRDRELQVEEGQPPMEVASAEQEALRWKREEDPREKWRRRREGRREPKESEEESLRAAEEAATDEAEEEEETGRLFDGRS